MLADYRVTRLVTVILAAQRPLLLYLPRIPVAGILSLVDGEWGWRMYRAAIPPVPSASPLLPSMAPVLSPAGGRIRVPAAKVDRRPPVEVHGDSQDEERHNRRFHKPPGAVVPGTRVPVIVLVDPVHAVVKEIVAIHAWSVVDRVARHQDEFRVQRQVDADAHIGQPDTDAYLGFGSRHRAEQQQRNHSVTYFLHFYLQW